MNNALLFLSRINPFGKKNNLDIKEETGINIERLIVQYPEIWEALKEVACSMMNRDARKMVTAADSEKNKFSIRIQAFDDLLKECLTIKSKKYDNTVNIHGHAPILEGKPGAPTLNPVETSVKKKNIFHYIMSKDIRDKTGKVKLTIGR